MVYIGGLIVILTAIAIVKKIEVRLVLFTSGMLMALLAGNILEGVDAFTNSMIHGSLVPIICTVMGFAYVLKLTRCDDHLVHLISEPMTKFRRILIPGAVIVTAFINISLTSAAGASAAVGAILIPALIAAGVHPATAAAAIFAGTFGSSLSPGNAQNVLVADIAGVDVMEVIGVLAPAVISAIIIGAISLTVTAFIRKEDSGYVAEGEVDEPTEKEIFKVNFLKALVPVFPLILLIATSSAVGLFETAITVPQAMLLGTAVAVLVSMKNPQEISKAFFDGMGNAYANIIGIIIAASVFTAGMSAIGLTNALIEVMENSEAIVGIAATFGPFVLAVLSGSGDAATIAFNNAITPNAALFGLETINLGSIAALAGALGRTMSPVAGAGIVCASIAKVSPVELAKRNAPGMLIAAVVVMFMMVM